MGRRAQDPSVTAGIVMIVVIAMLVLYFVFQAFHQGVLPFMEGGKDIKGRNYLEIQRVVKLCSAWRESTSYFDTIDLGLAKAFTDLQLNGEENGNLVCGDLKTDYEACVRKCVGLEMISEACATRGDDCYAITADNDFRCQLEGCASE